MGWQIGDKIRFADERGTYIVRAASPRYLVCTRPYNFKRTVFYTIVDLVVEIRGTENLIFGLGAETDRQCWEMLVRILTGESEISHRNRVPLQIRKD